MTTSRRQGQHLRTRLQVVIIVRLIQPSFQVNNIPPTSSNSSTTIDEQAISALKSITSTFRSSNSNSCQLPRQSQSCFRQLQHHPRINSFKTAAKPNAHLSRNRVSHRSPDATSTNRLAVSVRLQLYARVPQRQPRR